VEEKYSGIKVYKEEYPKDKEDFDTVDDEEFLDLLVKNKVQYNVFGKFWFYIGALTIIGAFVYIAFS
jgi:hypothetical protein